MFQQLALSSTQKVSIFRIIPDLKKVLLILSRYRVSPNSLHLRTFWNSKPYSRNKEDSISRIRTPLCCSLAYKRMTGAAQTDLLCTQMSTPPLVGSCAIVHTRTQYFSIVDPLPELLPPRHHSPNTKLVALTVFVASALCRTVTGGLKQEPTYVGVYYAPAPQ